MIDGHASTEMLIDDDEELGPADETAILDYPPLPPLAPPVCQARAARRRCVRRIHRHRSLQRRRNSTRKGSSLLALLTGGMAGGVVLLLVGI